MKHKDIIAAIEEFAPLRLQQEWDNSGWQVGDPETETTGVLTCLDTTLQILEEAASRKCNLIICHHPLLFRGVKQLTGRNRVERCIAEAIKRGISVYASHTSTDCAPAGVSWEMARRLQLKNCRILDPASSLGIVGDISGQPMTTKEFFDKVKTTFNCPALRISNTSRPDLKIKKVALCGGSAAEFLPEAIAAGADIYITADCKHNQFLDYADDILLVDAGHFETELCTKEIFYRIITEKFPNFAVCKSTEETSPVAYV